MNLKNLIAKGYFPKELPPAFTTYYFSDKLDDIEKEWALVPKNIQKKFSETKCADFSIPKVGINRRKLSMPNPLSQWLLAKCISENYTEINKIFVSKISASIPVHTHSGTRSLRTKLTYGDFRRSGALDSFAKVYEIKTDITRYYHTIYTHIIPWVLHTKAVAKARRRDESLLGNTLDKLIRQCQSGQTIGIPVGPDTSLIIAEIIGCWIDNEFAKRFSNFVGYRYVDDFDLFFSSVEQAERAIRTLQELFTSLNLDMNEGKTSITRSPHFFDNGWSYILANYRFSTDQKKQLYEIIRFFDISFKFSIDFPLDSVLKYSIKVLNNLSVESGNWSFFESLLMKTAITEPATLQEFSYIMYKNRSRVDINKITDVIYALLEEHIYKGHSFETCWALWLAKMFKIKIQSKIANILFEFIDPCSLIMAFDLREQGLIPANTKVNHLLDFFDDEGLINEHWIFIYESLYHKWLVPKDPQIIDKHPFFKILKSNNISFYHSKKIVKTKPPQQSNNSNNLPSISDLTNDELALLFNFKPLDYM